MSKTYSILFTTDGESRAVEYPANRADHLAYYYDLIECSCIDIVNAVGLYKFADENIKDESFAFLKDICMVVDDEALLVEDPVVNVPCSFLYGYAEHGQAIFGNVLICKNLYTPDGTDTIGLTPEEIHKFEIALNIMLMNEHSKRQANHEE